MRERNVFGKKINRVNFVLLLVFLFGAVIAARFGVLAFLDAQLARLETEQAELQGRIDAIIAAEEAQAYHEIGDIVDSLPRTYDQIGIDDELAFVRNLAGLSTATNYATTYLPDAANPFSAEVAASVKAIRITVTMTVDDPDAILSYLDHLGDLERIYYVERLEVGYLDDGAVITMTLYTFYNDVVI